MNKNILLLANQPDKAVNLSFMLRLSDIRSACINDDIEAFNYLAQRQSSTQPMELLLICEATIKQPILQMLNELERIDSMLPIILIQKNGNIPIEELNCHAHLKSMIKQCTATTTHGDLRILLKSLSEPSTETACNQS